MTTLFAVLLLVAAALAWLLRSPTHRSSDPTVDIERDELEAAEEEVRDLGASVGPDEADDELRDWGPGAPKP